MKRSYTVSIDGEAFAVDLVSRSSDSITFVIDGRSHTATISTPLRANVASTPYAGRADVAPVIAATAVPGAVVAPMPGIVTKILCKIGDPVKRGQPILIIEAMKMENNIAASTDGEVTELKIGAGEEVKKGQALVTIKP